MSNVKTKRFIVEVDYVEFGGYSLDAYDIEDAVGTTLRSMEMDGTIESFEGISVKEVTE